MTSMLVNYGFLLKASRKKPYHEHRSYPTVVGECKAKKEKYVVVSLRRSKMVHVVDNRVIPAVDDDITTGKGEELCEAYGFRKICEPLPDDITLRNIIDTLPKTVFEIDDVKAWKLVCISSTSYALGIYMITKFPWYILPLAWVWTGTTLAGFFALGHDCGHKSFLKNKMVEDIVGTLAFLPLLYPYESWRFNHNQHHAKTNMLNEDPSWQPITETEFNESPFLQNARIYGYGPMRPLMSIGHWLAFHFDLKKFRKHEVKRVKKSLACVFAFVVIGWPLIVYKVGIVGWIKLWFMPWLLAHFWISTMTMIHHTAPHIPFKHRDDWNAAQAHLNGTVHCDYPRWVEILNHDSNVHIPHHISPKIPCYNLRAAHKSLQKNWGKYMNEASWNWRLMKTIMTTCHMYSEKHNYISFEEFVPDKSQAITFLRRVMPN